MIKGIVRDIKCKKENQVIANIKKDVTEVEKDKIDSSKKNNSK